MNQKYGHHNTPRNVHRDTGNLTPHCLHTALAVSGFHTTHDLLMRSGALSSGQFEVGLPWPVPPHQFRAAGVLSVSAPHRGRLSGVSHLQTHCLREAH